MIETSVILSIITLIGVAINSSVLIFKKSSCEVTKLVKCKTGGGDDDIELQIQGADGSTTKLSVPQDNKK